ncbi:hypothetical protein QTP70_034259 [Hemibagrus guttatus]|uniref:Uncharacterized protein n=1 Tax=Hemibagrus guttatus TaxID=175788 RepID=A0AAE0PVA4_9TELE|nr:hypothetical protein QTP70_034259 [Hemibagrus guttatus]KAK3525064.1 hypothetical protein QTP86_014347 [Hemibagrus guttatus]
MSLMAKGHAFRQNKGKTGAGQYKPVPIQHSWTSNLYTFSFYNACSGSFIRCVDVRPLNQWSACHVVLCMGRSIWFCTS